MLYLITCNSQDCPFKGNNLDECINIVDSICALARCSTSSGINSALDSVICVEKLDTLEGYDYTVHVRFSKSTPRKIYKNLICHL